MAVTVLFSVIETEQEPVPEHAPLQPVNVYHGVAEALRVMLSFALYDSVQSDPQFIPAGVDVIVPCPTTVVVSTFGTTTELELTEKNTSLASDTTPFITECIQNL